MITAPSQTGRSIGERDEQAQRDDGGKDCRLNDRQRDLQHAEQRRQPA